MQDIIYMQNEKTNNSNIPDTKVQKTKKKHKNIIRHIVIAMILCDTYCAVWMLLEYLIEGAVKNNIVDNIIMAALLPVFWLAAGQINNIIKTGKKESQEKCKILHLNTNTDNGGIADEHGK